MQLGVWLIGIGVILILWQVMRYFWLKSQLKRRSNAEIEALLKWTRATKGFK